MTEKRFQYNVNKNCIEYDGKFVAYLNSVDGCRIANYWNGLYKENEQLKSDLEEYCNFSLHDVLDKKNKEIEQLKSKLEDWHQRTFKAHEYFNLLEKVIDEVCDDDISNQIWKEYEKREKLVE